MTYVYRTARFKFFTLPKDKQPEPVLCLPYRGVRFKGKDGKMQILSLEEFGEYLRTNGGETSRWGTAILELVDVGADHEDLLGDIESVLPVQEGEAYGDVVKRAAGQAETLERVRAVLVETGAMAADDTATDPADLVRALLS